MSTWHAICLRGSWWCTRGRHVAIQVIRGSWQCTYGWQVTVPLLSFWPLTGLSRVHRQLSRMYRIVTCYPRVYRQLSRRQIACHVGTNVNFNESFLTTGLKWQTNYIFRDLNDKQITFLGTWMTFWYFQELKWQWTTLSNTKKVVYPFCLYKN